VEGKESASARYLAADGLDQVSNRDIVQVQRRDGEWVDAVPIPNTVLINIGDLLQRWTSDKLISTV